MGEIIQHVAIGLVLLRVDDGVAALETVLYIDKGQRNKKIKDLPVLCEILSIEPVSKFIIPVAKPAQDGLAEMEETSLVGYIQTKDLEEGDTLSMIKVNTDCEVIY